jgi:predicted component of type VI protein secretion system
LRQVAPSATSETWEVADAPQQIGRVDSPIRLADRTVSRRHARISPTQDGFILEDLGSTSGTYINDRQITAATPVHHGDRLGFGDVLLSAEVGPPKAAGPGALTGMQPGPPPTLMYVGEPVPPVIATSRLDSRVSLVDATVSEVPASPPAPTPATPAPRARRRPENAAARVTQPPVGGLQPATPSGVNGCQLSPFEDSVHELTASIRQLERDIAVIVAQQQALIELVRSGRPLT